MSPDRFSSVLIKCANRLPRRLFYPSAYQKIYRLLSLQSAGHNVGFMLRGQLACLLRSTLASVPHYRDLHLGIRPADVHAENAFDVLSGFPLLTKRDIMVCPERFVSDRYDLDHLKTGTSGGSTGEGIRVFYNIKQQLLERCFFDHRWHAAAGWRRSSRTARIGCDGIQTADRHPCSRYADKLLVSPYHMNSKWIAEIFRSIAAFSPEYFHSYPSSFEYLVRYMDENNLCLRNTKGIFLASERVTSSLLDLIQKVFPGVPTIFHYGLTERTNLAWGQYVPGCITYRFDDVYGFSENVVDSHGRHEIVGTSYWNDVIPLIRYRTQDYGKIVDGVMHELDGREQEYLVTRDGDRVPGCAISIDMSTWDSVEVFQVVQNRMGEIEFHIVPRKHFNPNVQRAILADQVQKWGRLFDMSVVIRDAIDMTASGKRRLVVNNMSPKEESR